MQVHGVQVAPSYESSFRACAAYELFRPSNNRRYVVYDCTEESEPTIWVISIRAPLGISKAFLKQPIILWNLGGSLLRVSQKRCFVAIANDHCYRLSQWSGLIHWYRFLESILRICRYLGITKLFRWLLTAICKYFEGWKIFEKRSVERKFQLILYATEWREWGYYKAYQ